MRRYSAASTLFQIVVDGGDAYSVVIAKTSSGKNPPSAVGRRDLGFQFLSYSLLLFLLLRLKSSARLLFRVRLSFRKGPYLLVQVQLFREGLFLRIRFQSFWQALCLLGRIQAFARRLLSVLARRGLAFGSRCAQWVVVAVAR